MKYLLDTCVLSELVKKNPTPSVILWFNQHPAEQLYISSISFAEIRKGIYKLKTTQAERANALLQWLYGLEQKFLTRTLALDHIVLEDWANICAKAELSGHKLAVMDSLIAATAHTHQLVLVTRNIADFQHAGAQIENPFA